MAPGLGLGLWLVTHMLLIATTGKCHQVCPHVIWEEVRLPVGARTRIIWLVQSLNVRLNLLNIVESTESFAKSLVTGASASWALPGHANQPIINASIITVAMNVIITT